MIRQADKLLCESWNEKMWADGGPIDPSPSVDQAVNGGYPWLEIECSRCKTKRDVDLAVLRHAATTAVHDLASRLRCSKCARAGGRPSGLVKRVSRCNSAKASGPAPTSLSAIVGAGTGDAGAITASTAEVAALCAASAGPRQRIASR